MARTNYDAAKSNLIKFADAINEARPIGSEAAISMGLLSIGMAILALTDEVIEINERLSDLP